MSAKPQDAQTLTPTLQVGVKALLLNAAQDHFLGIQRHHAFFDQHKKYGKAPEKYDIPGGRIEFGEEPEQGLRREIEEEIDLSLPAHCEFRPLTAANIVATPERQIVRITYVVDNFSLDDLSCLTLSDEHQALAWLPLTSSADLHPLLNQSIEVFVKTQQAIQPSPAASQLRASA